MDAEWLLAELLLNIGYTKSQIAVCLDIPLGMLNSFLDIHAEFNELPNILIRKIKNIYRYSSGAVNQYI